MDFIEFYEGCIAPDAGISHIIHDYEEIFLNNNDKIINFE
jgi:hypothetical protein